MKKCYYLVLALLLLIITPVAAAETINETVDGDKHIITIYDEGPMIARVFDKPGTATSNVWITRAGNVNEIRRMVIHRDIGDLDHIIFASDKVAPIGYDRVDQVPITVYWDPSHSSYYYFPPTFNGTYVGSGTMYAYSNSITEEGHLTLIFDDWDSSIYQHHQDIRIFCWIEAARPLNFSKIRMGNTGGEVSKENPVNDDVVCGIFARWDKDSSESYYYGLTTHLYTKGGVFEHEIHYSYLTPEIIDVEIHRSVAGTQYGSVIKIFSSNHTDEPYFIDTTATSVVRAHLPPSESPFVVEIYSPSIDKTYTVTLYGDSPTPTPTEDSGLTVYIKNSQTGALIANANVVIDALVDGEYYQVTNRTEPSGIFTINLQPTGGGKPNPDGYRLIVTADGYNNPMPEINFTVDDYKLSIYCLLDPIAGGPVNETKTFIDFFVRDMSSNPISGATVKFGKYTLITNSAGYTVFEVDKNNNYTWTISKSGYGPLTGNAVIGDAPRHTINTVLAPIVTPTTPIPTSPPIGPTPTMTAPTGEHVNNWLEWFAAHFGMILGGGVEIGKIFMWLCFTVPVGVYVGKEAKAGAAGFMAGAGIVTLFFVLIGWVPIWLVVLLALIIGLLYAKVLNTPDNGGGR